MSKFDKNTKRISKRFEEPYRQEFINSMDYLRDLKLLDETENTIRADIINKLTNGQNKGLSLDGIFGRSIYKYIRKEARMIEGSKAIVLNFMTKFLQDIFVVLAVYFIIGIIKFLGGWADNNLISIDFTLLLQMYVVVLTMVPVMEKATEIESSIHKIVLYVGYMIGIFGVSFVILEMVNILGLNTKFVTKSSFYLLFTSSTYIVKIIIEEYLNRRK